MHPVVRVGRRDAAKGTRQVIAEHGIHVDDLAQLAALVKFPAFLPGRVVQLIVTDANQPLGRHRRGEDFLRLRDIDREWFLNVHVEARGQRLQGERAMRVRRRGHVQNVGTDLGQHLAEIGEYPRHAKTGSRLLRQVEVLVADGHGPGARNAADLTQMGIRDLPAADQGHS